MQRTYSLRLECLVFIASIRTFMCLLVCQCNKKKRFKKKNKNQNLDKCYTKNTFVTAVRDCFSAFFARRTLCFPPLVPSKGFYSRWILICLPIWEECANMLAQHSFPSLKKEKRKKSTARISWKAKKAHPWLCRRSWGSSCPPSASWTPRCCRRSCTRWSCCRTVSALWWPVRWGYEDVNS